jgi:molybdopterin molybdotransferase
MAALSVDEALARILEGVAPLDPEPAELMVAHGRVLAADCVAQLTQPPFDASAMDGYAVRAADVTSLPATLTVTGEAAAGAGHRGAAVGAGQAVRIFTGAPLPAGADAIVIQENTTRDGSILTVRVGTPNAEHIRPAGGDFVRGQVLLQAGRVLDARALTLAAAGGHATLSLRRRPQVAIIATGDELVPPGTTPGPDQIVSSNPVGLAALVRAFGGQPLVMGIASDTLSDLEVKLDAARHADIVVTTGGASVGDHDLVRPALKRRGMALDFWQIAMRPGKPLLFAKAGPQRVLGLPGNPVSALITGRVFLAPLITALLGSPARPLIAQRAITTAAIEANGPRQHYMRATLDTGPSGGGLVTPASSQDSSLLTALASADVLIVRPPHASATPAGGEVAVISIDF